jgi:triacylglycerol esterase/lipase EstA (alpha/beta hydrolase family)
MHSYGNDLTPNHCRANGQGIVILVLILTISGCGWLEARWDSFQSARGKNHSEDLRTWDRPKDGLPEDGLTDLIILVHGFNSSKDKAWGKLPVLILDDADFKTFAIHRFGYASEICRNDDDIEHEGDLLKSFLTSTIPKYRSTTLVGHSMGGLVILHALLKLERDDFQLIKSADIKVLTFGTPYRGVEEATILNKLFFCMDRQVRDVTLLSHTLFKLEVDWIKRFNQFTEPGGRYTPQIPIFTYYGSGDQFVRDTTACLISASSPCEQVDGDHSSMVALLDDATTKHLTYQKLRDHSTTFPVKYSQAKAKPEAPPSSSELQILNLGKSLRDEYRSVRDRKTDSLPSDFSRAQNIIEKLSGLDPQSGFAWYYAGEIKRITASALFSSKSCPKTIPPDGALDLDPYHNDFYRYLDFEETLPEKDKQGNTGSEVCYARANGYCRQRTGWIHHLLANDFYEQGLSVADRDIKLSKYRRALFHATAARDYYPKGFEQCTATDVLEDKLKREVSTSKAESTQEQSKEEQRRNQMPHLAGTVDTVSIGPIIHGNVPKTFVSMIATIRSTGAKTNAENYRLTVRLVDGTTKQASTLTIPDGMALIYPDGMREGVKVSDALYNKTFKPIDMVVRGRLMFLVDLPSDSDRSRIAEYEIRFNDITGKSYTASRKPDQTGPNTDVEFPGMEPRLTK